MTRLLSLLLLCLTGTALGQHRPLVVMNLAAHPDDEDGRTLTYYRYAHDAVAYSVIFNRGEGGQNEIGPELYEALGAIRTVETERAARLLGTQVFFLNFKDFGYSKHADEAFAQWGGRDAVTARLVYLVRKLKPDVLFTNHDTLSVAPNRQHGQHQAVGWAAYDAFSLAADPTYHPEQLAEPGVDLWQPQRLFLRLWLGYHQGWPVDVEVPVGRADTTLGRSYNEQAIAALFEHASQGMGQFADRLRTPTTAFMLVRTATSAPLDSTDLAGHLPPNHTATPSLAYLIDSHRLPRLPEGALWLADSLLVPGQRVTLRWEPDALPTRRINWRFFGAVDTTLYLSDHSPGVATLLLPTTAAPTVPAVRYQYDRYVNHPPVTYAMVRAGTEEVLAAGHLPLQIAPPLVLTSPRPVVRLKGGANAVPLQVARYAPQPPAALSINVAVTRNADRSVVYQQQHRRPAPAAAPAAYTDTLHLSLPADLAEGAYTLHLTALPATTANTPSPPARLQIAGEAFSVAVPPSLHVGVIESYDTTLGDALLELGIAHTRLDSTALAEGTFEDFHTIVVDIRAYLVRPDLRRHNDRLLQWVADGGHLVVNYQKTFEWNAAYQDPFDASQTNPGTFAPYPLELGRDRVTREEAPVTVLQPDHPLFHAPNTLTAAIWDGWVQERGLYFPRTYDAQYQELFSLQDPGEAPLRSSTLLAQHGRGTYLYTALGWYRQLKRFHPGAYAAYANFLSLPMYDGRQRVLP